MLISKVNENNQQKKISDELENSETKLSFIIPALNEEKNILRAIISIKKTTKDNPHEIIVVDNGSTDNTIAIAKNQGAITIIDKNSTIGGLRNIGVKKSTGDIIVFIDADIELSEDWLYRLTKKIKTWPKNKLIVTGSSYLVVDNSSFVEQHWYSKFSETGSNYINSGHLITTKHMFYIIDGFDESLKTAEDYDFCQRAKKAGGVIIKERELKAYHHGYPKTLADFFMREAWHGRQDISSIYRFFNSKIAMLAIFNSVILSVSFIFSLYIKNINLFFYSATLSIVLCLILSYKKFGPDKPLNMIKTAFCCELYLFGRTASIFFKLKRPAARN